MIRATMALMLILSILVPLHPVHYKGPAKPFPKYDPMKSFRVEPKAVQETPQIEPQPVEMVIETTAYTYTGKRTRTGTVPGRGTISVDPKLIPLGSRIWVEGYGWGIAEDTGGAIKGAKMDLFMLSVDECIQWGRQKVRVKIYSP